MSSNQKTFVICLLYSFYSKVSKSILEFLKINSIIATHYMIINNKKIYSLNFPYVALLGPGQADATLLRNALVNRTYYMLHVCDT